MSKAGTIKSLKDSHRELKKVIDSLTQVQMTKVKIIGDWTVKDILAHIAGWNWEYLEEIERVLKNQATWHRLYGTKGGEASFNRREVTKRKPLTSQEVRREWEDSFQALVDKVAGLSESDWRHQSGNDRWASTGVPVTVHSLFAYEYEEQTHEAGHAQQIKQALSGAS